MNIKLNKKKDLEFIDTYIHIHQTWSSIVFQPKKKKKLEAACEKIINRIFTIIPKPKLMLVYVHKLIFVSPSKTKKEEESSFWQIYVSVIDL